MLGPINGVGTLNVLEIDANSHNNIIKKCLFENAEGEALRIKGTNNTIENNYFHHIDWSVSDLEGLMVTIYSGSNAEDNTFTKNTIHTTGASATVLPGKDSEFSYNKVSNTGLLQSDGAVFQGTTKFVEGSNVHHNFVYDTEKYAYKIYWLNCLIKQLKNRYSDPGKHKRFVIGIDRAKMKLYDLEETAQDDLVARSAQKKKKGPWTKKDKDDDPVFDVGTNKC